jgi:hypothetical protein
MTIAEFARCVIEDPGYRESVVARENRWGTVHLRCSSMNDASGADSPQLNPELPAGAGGT